MVSDAEPHTMTMKLIAIVVSLSPLLGACEPSVVAAKPDVVMHEIAGANSNFCVPRERDVQPPSWVPENRPGTQSGFAFEGCWSADLSNQQKCELPSAFKTGGVGPKSVRMPRLWQDLAPNTFYRSVVNEPHTRLEVFDAGSTVVVSNKRLWSDWWVWKKAVPLTSDTAPFISDNDELAAVCQLVKDVSIPKSTEKRDIFSCKRVVVADDYAFDYSFESKTRIPSSEEMKSIDSGIKSALESWRCK